MSKRSGIPCAKINANILANGADAAALVDCIGREPNIARAYTCHQTARAEKKVRPRHPPNIDTLFIKLCSLEVSFTGNQPADSRLPLPARRQADGQ